MAELMEAGRLDFRSLLDAERAELLNFLGDLGVADWAAPTECPAWSVKGVALHLLGDDLSILSRQRDGEPSRVAIEAGSDWRSLFVALDRHNEQWVAASSDFSVRLLVDLLRLSGEEAHRWYNTVDANLLGEAIPWVGPEPAPYWLLCAREYLERWIHHSQIRRAVDRGEWFDERWVDAAVAVAVRGFPAGLAALPAPDGATVTLAVDGGPAWTVRQDDGSWRLYDGSPDKATVALRLDRPGAALLVSRGMTKAEVVERLKLEGDDELCQLFSIGLSAFFGR
jgi:uncharacterized protein (TIGR03083 family)